MRNVLVVLAILLAVTTDAQSFQPDGPRAVYDANGKLVGEYLGSGEVSVKINGGPSALLARRTTLTSSLDLLFDQPNCQGNAYIYASGVSHLLSNPAAFAPDGTVRIAKFGTPIDIQVNSIYRDSDHNCNSIPLSVRDVLPTEVGPNLKAAFVAPFSVGPSAVPAVNAAPVPANNMWLLLCIVGAIAIFGFHRLR